MQIFKCNFIRDLTERRVTMKKEYKVIEHTTSLIAEGKF